MGAEYENHKVNDVIEYMMRSHKELKDYPIHIILQVAFEKYGELGEKMNDYQIKHNVLNDKNFVLIRKEYNVVQVLLGSLMIKFFSTEYDYKRIEEKIRENMKKMDNLMDSDA